MRKPGTVLPASDSSTGELGRAGLAVLSDQPSQPTKPRPVRSLVSYSKVDGPGCEGMHLHSRTQEQRQADL